MSIISVKYLVFIAIVVLVYYVIPKKWQWIWLLLVSYVFYLMAGVQYIGYLLFTTLSTFLCGRWLEALEKGYLRDAQGPEGPKPLAERKALKAAVTRKKRGALALAMVANFGVLAFVKYIDFAIGNVNLILSRLDAGRIGFFNIALPLGISFYIFQSMGYLVDVYRGKTAADTNPFRFALFVSYFPQIIQGPIGRHQPLTAQLYAPHGFDYDRVKFGAQRMLWGFIKKMVIADRIAVVVNTVFSGYMDNDYRGVIVFIAVLLYGIQIYADFSGGMEIVCGASEMLGIDLAENFRRPFFARSVAEFWQRWHITLGAWMRDYLFYPLALSKPFNKMSRALRKFAGTYVAKVLPTCLASFIVFVLIGLWHGASWKYVVYGIYQAIFVSTATLLEPLYVRGRAFFKVRPESFGFRMFQVTRTILLITAGRYLSRAVSLMSALALYKRTFSYNPWVLFDGTLYKLGLDQPNFLLMILLIGLLFFVDFLQERGIHLRECIARQGIVFRWAIYLAAIFLILIFGMYGQNFDAASFIYQGF